MNKRKMITKKITNLKKRNKNAVEDVDGVIRVVTMSMNVLSLKCQRYNSATSAANMELVMIP